MNNLVSNKNIVDILSGISDKILADINNKDITEDQKVILNKVNNMVINGNGLKILTDNGSYKECNAEELKTAINNTDNVFDLFNISLVKQEESWQSKTAMPTDRCGLTSSIYQDNIYCIGGQENSKDSNKNECYNVSTDTWSTKANMLTGRYALTCGIYKDKIYCIGGRSGSALDKNESYDITTNTWSSKASMLTGRMELASCIYNDKIYVIGANDKNECYDITTDTWSTKANMPTARKYPASCIYNDKIYVIGGYYSGYASANEIYDISTDTWSAKANMPTNRYGLTSNIYKGKIYCIGGYRGSSYLTTNEVYNINTNTWETKLGIPTSRWAATSNLYKAKIYCIGSGTSQNNNECYSIDDMISEYDLILPDTIQNKLDVIKQNGEGTKILSDNGNYIDIPKGYRYMNQQEVDDVILILSNKLNGGE